MLVLEDRIGNVDAPIRLDDDFRSRVGTAVEAFHLGVDGDSGTETASEVMRPGDRHAASGGPDQPKCAVRPEGRGRNPCAGKARIGASRRCAAVLVLLGYGSTRKTKGGGQDDRVTHHACSPSRSLRI